MLTTTMTIPARRPLAAALALLVITSAGCPGAPTDTATDLAPAGDLAGSVSDGSNAGDLSMPYVRTPGCSADAWCWIFPPPQGNTLWTVWSSSATEAWAGGDSGTLLHYTAGSWHGVLSPAAGAIRGIWGADANNVYFVGERATVLRWDGTSFSQLAVPATPPKRITTLYGVWGRSASDVWMVGTGGVVLHYDGAALSEMTTPDQSLLVAVWGTSAGSVYAVSTAGAGIEVLHFDPVGKTWTLMNTIPTTSSPTSIWGTGDSDYYVSGSGGDIYHWNGTANAQVRAAGGFAVNALWGSGASVFAVGDVQYTDLVIPDLTARKGTFLQWNGTAFVDVAGAAKSGFYGLWGNGATDVFMVGASGTLAHYDGNSVSTSSPYEPLTGIGAPMTGITGGSAADLIAVGDYGATLHYNGTSFASMPANVHLRFRAAAGSGNSLFAIGQDTSMGTAASTYRWTGSAWVAETVPAASDLRGLWASSTLALAVGASDQVLRRSGTNWSAATVGSAGSTVLRAVYAVDAAHIWAVGGGNAADNTAANPTRILFSSDGNSFTPLAGLPVSTIILRGVWGAAPNDVWAVGDSSTILHWDGTAWQSVATTTFPALRAVWGRDASTVFAVGDGGLILRWNGTAWKVEDGGTVNGFVSVWGVGQDVYALGRNGMVLHKTVP